MFSKLALRHMDHLKVSLALKDLSKYMMIEHFSRQKVTLLSPVKKEIPNMITEQFLKFGDAKIKKRKPHSSKK